jgi:hypothetical protein
VRVRHNWYDIARAKFSSSSANLFHYPSTATHHCHHHGKSNLLLLLLHLTNTNTASAVIVIQLVHAIVGCSVLFCSRFFSLFFGLIAAAIIVVVIIAYRYGMVCTMYTQNLTFSCFLYLFLLKSHLVQACFDDAAKFSV